MVDQPVGGAVVSVDAALSHHLWLDGLGQLFAKLHPPLIVGVDIPDNALGEDLHLVHGQHGPQCEGGHPVHHDGVGRSVSCELFVGSNQTNLSLRLASLLQLSHNCGSVFALNNNIL